MPPFNIKDPPRDESALVSPDCTSNSPPIPTSPGEIENTIAPAFPSTAEPLFNLKTPLEPDEVVPE